MKRSFIIKIITICLVTINAYATDKVVLFGDSLMAGYGLPQEEHLAAVLENSLLKSGYDIQIINGSVSGSTSSGGLNRIKWTLSEPNIDLLILCLGANDMLRGINPRETQKNLEKIIQITKQKNIDIIVAGMIAPTSHGIDYKKKFDNIYLNLSKKYNLSLIPFLLENVVSNPNLNQDDGIHPNKKGVIAISTTLQKYIIKHSKF